MSPLENIGEVDQAEDLLIELETATSGSPGWLVEDSGAEAAINSLRDAIEAFYALHPDLVS